jgi:hypothetical protein
MISRDVRPPVIADADLIDWATIWPTIDLQVRKLSTSAAIDYGISERDLLISTRLHLPRLGPEEITSEIGIMTEVNRVAQRTRSARWAYLSSPIPYRPLPLKHNSARFMSIESGVARIIHERFHYVGSFRDGLHFGIFDEYLSPSHSLPVVMATVSELDVEHLRSLMPNLGDRGKAAVLSRVYSFDHAPRNGISYLLGRITDWLKTNLPEVRVLFTYVNPNLGFTGVSYRAANWKEISEKSVSYRYIDSNYVSARKCELTAGDERLLITRSAYRLLPLRIWSYAISGKRAEQN